MNKAEETIVHPWADLEASLQAEASEKSLRDAYHLLQSKELDGRGKKLLAEISYLLAQSSLRRHDVQSARALANESIALYEELGVDSLEAAAPVLYKQVPDIMHQDVVRARILDEL